MTLTKRVSEYLKYQFSDAENTENARALARTTRQLAEHQLKKKQLAADLKLQEEQFNNEIATLSRFVTDGYDFRMIECVVRFDDPRDGQKTIFRVDTGETVRIERMTDSEKQMELPIPETKAETAEAGPSWEALAEWPVANEHGVFTCQPTKVIEFRKGRNEAQIKALQVAQDEWIAVECSGHASASHGSPLSTSDAVFSTMEGAVFAAAEAGAQYWQRSNPSTDADKKSRAALIEFFEGVMREYDPDGEAA